MPAPANISPVGISSTVISIIFFLLAEIVAPDQFKTYDELRTRLDYVLGNKKSAAPQFEEEDIDRGEAEELVTAAVSKPTPAVAEEEDDALSYFAKLAEE